jgi:putative RNA 2'-phosphotransferase
VNEKETIRLSKRLSSWLRHNPQAIGLDLDSAGWVGVDELIRKAGEHGKGFGRAQLDFVVENNNKRRYEFDVTGTRIRARQGHSIPVDLGYEPADPPPRLFHGTAQRNLGLIMQDGLLPMARHAVHLSADTDTAVNVGSRHGKPVVLIVDTARMLAEGAEFFVSGNGVWLIDHVPAEYLEVLA